MTEKVKLLRPSAFAGRAELFYSDITGRTLGLTVCKNALDGYFSMPSVSGFSGVAKAGFTFSEKGGLYIADYFVCDNEEFLDFRKRLIEKERKLEESDLRIAISCRIPIRILEKNTDGVKISEKFFALSPIVNPRIYDFMNGLFIECERAGVKIDSFMADEDGLIMTSVSGNFCEIADKILFIKVIAKRLSERSDLSITFMPKPFFDKKGGGLDVKVEVMGDQRSSFLEGVILHSPESLCMLAPTVNSFLRLKEKSGYLCHGKGDDVLFRTQERADMITFSFDFGDVSGNTYIGFCALIESGLMGIQQGLVLRDGVAEITPAIQKDTGRLPFSLGEALKIGWSSGFISGTLGESASRVYFAEKKKECESLDKTSGEGEHRARYFDVY